MRDSGADSKRKKLAFATPNVNKKLNRPHHCTTTSSPAVPTAQELLNKIKSLNLTHNMKESGDSSKVRQFKIPKLPYKPSAETEMPRQEIPSAMPLFVPQVKSPQTVKKAQSNANFQSTMPTSSAYMSEKKM